MQKWDEMCMVEDNGGRPIYRSREWHDNSRRTENERELESWNQRDKDQPSAPLIIDPTAGNLTAKLKQVC